jgi:hypothetical protein
VAGAGFDAGWRDRQHPATSWGAHHLPPVLFRNFWGNYFRLGSVNKAYRAVDGTTCGIGENGNRSK